MKWVINLILLPLTLFSGWAFGQTTLKVGSIGILPEAATFIALGKGYFAEVGLNLELVRFDSGAQMVAPLSTGEIPVAVGVGTSPGLYNAIARDLPIKIVGSQTYFAKGHSSSHFMVRTDLKDQIKRVSDLKGRKVAINAHGSPLRYILGKTLESAGLSLKDVDVKVIAFPEMSVALSTKAIDMAMAPDPTAALIEDKGLGVRWKTGHDFVPNMQNSVIMFNQEWAEKNPQAANQFMLAWLKGTRFYYDALATGKNRSEVIDILIKYTPVKQKPIYDKMEWVFADPNGYIVRESLEKEQDFYQRDGQVPRKADINKMIDERYLNYALEKLGTYPCDLCVKKR